MDSQIIKIGSTVINISNVTDVDLDADPQIHIPYARDHIGEDDLSSHPVVVLYTNATTSDEGGNVFQEKVVLEGEEAELMRAYFDQFAFDLIERSTSHATAGES